MKQLLPILFLSLSFLATGVLAQDYPGCDGSRFRAAVFDEVQVTEGLKFGEGTTIAGNMQELFLDVYEPVGDEQETRPLIMLAFGGSFITGERGDMATLCEAYARQGYVAVSIDYRLYDLPLLPLPTSDEMRDVVVKSLSDYKAAIRFMREDAATDNEFRIDPDQVFIGGVSAGAIAAAHTAVLQESDDIDDFTLSLIEANGGFEGNSSTNTEYSSAVQGYINMSGALNNAAWMSEGDPPFVSIHDDGDTTVPYGSGYAQVLGFNIVMLEGSERMEMRADSLNIANALWTIENSDAHVSYLFEPDDFAASIDFTSSFVHDQICGEIVNVEDVSLELQEVNVFPNPADDVIQIRNEKGLLLQVRLFDAAGRLLLNAENPTQLTVGNFPRGMYWLEVTNIEDGQKVIQKISLQ